MSAAYTDARLASAERTTEEAAQGAARAPSDHRLTQLSILLLPALMFVDIRMVGQLYLPEVIMVVLLPGLLWARGRLLLARIPKTVLVLGLFWLSSQVLTDLFRTTPFVDWSRGWAKIAVFLLEFAVLYLLVNGRKDRMLLFLTGMAIGQLATFIMSPSEYAVVEPWKFGYGPALTSLVIVGASVRPLCRHLPLQIVLLVSIGFLNLFMGSRSIFLICFLVAAYVFASGRENRRRSGWSTRRHGRLWFTVLILLIVGAASGLVYGFAAEQGLLGHQARLKYAAQSGGRYGVLLGGRVGVLASSQAIIDSPVLGHGSWAKDWKYQNLLDRRLAELGYGGAPYLGTGAPPIPAHSYLLGAWVESGVIGAIFWLWVLLVTLRAAKRVYLAHDAHALLFGYTAALLVWGILFSPFAAQEKAYAAFFLAVVVSFATHKLRRQGRGRYLGVRTSGREERGVWVKSQSAGS